MRRRATKAQKKARIERIMDALAQDIPDDLILKALLEEGLSERQAFRYVQEAYQALETLALLSDSVQQGKAIQRMKRLARTTFQAASQGDDPEGKKARVAVMASKGVMDLLKSAQVLRKEKGKPNEKSTKQASGASGLAALLQRFAQDQATG